MGKATMIFHTVLVLIQFLILRKDFKLWSLLQIPVGVMFGYFTTFCNYFVSFLPDPKIMGIRIFMMLISTIIIAVGIGTIIAAFLVGTILGGINKLFGKKRDMLLA